jgi:predicted CoA-binding protein
MAFLQTRGYRDSSEPGCAGETFTARSSSVRADALEIAEPIDLVDVFRKLGGRRAP